MELDNHRAYMTGWRMWEKGKPRPKGKLNRAGWDAANRSAGELEKVPLTDYADAMVTTKEVVYEDDGNILRRSR